MPRFFFFSLLFVSALPAFGADPASSSRPQVKVLKITILSTMLADGDALGEWGFSALVEADGHRILFDTGRLPDVVLRNAQALKIDLATVPDVVLSHSHSDHTGGFLPLRRSVAAKSPAALARTYVGPGFFLHALKLLTRRSRARCSPSSRSMKPPAVRLLSATNRGSCFPACG